MQNLRRVFERLLESVCLLLMVSLAVVVVAGVIFRKAGAPLVWYDEVASVILAWLTYYGSSLAALRHAHIGFPKLVQSVGPEFRLPLLVVREIFVIGFFVLVAWAGWRVVVVLDGFSMVSLPWVSRQFTDSVIPVGAVLFIVAEILSFSELLHGSERAGGEAQLQ
jgi:TRAP-type C4-dicarboxylate transport system permease small subunit